MRASSVIKGIAAVAAVGTAAYLYSNSSPRTKRKIKRTTGKAMHSMGEMMNGITGMM